MLDGRSKHNGKHSLSPPISLHIDTSNTCYKTKQASSPHHSFFLVSPCLSVDSGGSNYTMRVTYICSLVSTTSSSVPVVVCRVRIDRPCPRTQDTKGPFTQRHTIYLHLFIGRRSHAAITCERIELS